MGVDFAGVVEAVETMGGEPWGRVTLERGDELSGADSGLALADMVTATYMTAAASRLVDDAAEHARTRQQSEHLLVPLRRHAEPHQRRVAAGRHRHCVALSDFE